MRSIVVNLSWCCVVLTRQEEALLLGLVFASSLTLCVSTDLRISDFLLCLIGFCLGSLVGPRLLCWRSFCWCPMLVFGGEFVWPPFPLMALEMCSGGVR